MSSFFAVGIAALSLIVAAPAVGETLHFTTHLDGPAETPPNTTKATGVADVALDTDAKTLSWTISYSGLSGPVTMAHFHGPAARGVAAGVVLGLQGPLTSPVTGHAALNDGQIGDLRAGLWYLNLHTALNPRGEIRGQLTVVKPEQKGQR